MQQYNNNSRIPLRNQPKHATSTPCIFIIRILCVGNHARANQARPAIISHTYTAQHSETTIQNIMSGRKRKQGVVYPPKSTFSNRRALLNKRTTAAGDISSRPAHVDSHNHSIEAKTCNLHSHTTLDLPNAPR